MALLFEEFGRALLQSPYFTTVTLGAQAILSFGTEEQKHKFLPRIANGEVIMTLALTEVDAGSDLASMSTTATADGEDYIINGTKLHINNAHLADYMIVAAKTAPNSSDDDSITLFLIGGNNPNITCVPMKTLGLERRNEVVFGKVQVSKKDVLGELNQGADIIEVVNNAKIMLCAEAMGGAQKALEIAIDYSKRRFAFGAPIGALQALQHKMADMAVAIDGSRWLSYYAAWLMSQSMFRNKELAMAKLFAGETYRMVTAEAIQVLGGYGVMQEQPIGLYFRRAKEIQLSLGYTHALKEAIATSILS
jgi:alkylation response protein AidB-like acyl-CoA dehydrogenase